MTEPAPKRPTVIDRLRATWRRILNLDDTPHSIALGVFIGTIVAYQPIVGLQMIVGAIICKLIKANVVASLPIAWITNPVTIVPIYYATYRLGLPFTGGKRITYDDLKVLWARIDEMSFLDGVIEGTRLLLDIFWPMVVGGLIIGIVNGAIFYVIVRRFVTAYQARSIRNHRASRTLSEEEAN